MKWWILDLLLIAFVVWAPWQALAFLALIAGILWLFRMQDRRGEKTYGHEGDLEPRDI